MIGFIGLGIMGKPMALNLLEAGVAVMANDLSTEVEKIFYQKGGKLGTYAEIGEDCQIIFTMLSDGGVVQEVLFGENGVVTTAKAGTIVCDLSSVTPDESRFCHEKFKKLGVDFLDAPVSGGEPGAVDGTLAFMVGGEKNIYLQVEPYFNIMGQTSVLVGESGSGSMTKLANQMIVNNTIAVISEAFTYVAKAGVDSEKVFHAIRGGLAGSSVLEAKLPQILARDFKPGGKLTINHKDIKNALTAGHELDAVLPYTSLLFEIMQTLKVHNLLEQDHSAIVKYFEQFSNVKVGGSK